MATQFVQPNMKPVLWLPELGTERYHEHQIEETCECEPCCAHKIKLVELVEG
jgi:hypothetical protein